MATFDFTIKLSTRILAEVDGFEPSNPFLNQTVFKTVPLSKTVALPYKHVAEELSQ